MVTDGILLFCSLLALAACGNPIIRSWFDDDDGGSRPPYRTTLVLTVDATDQQFIIPTMGKDTSGNASSLPYDWKISINDIPWTGISWGSGGSFTVTSPSFSTVGISIIKIRPTNLEAGWLRAFGFSTGAAGANLSNNKTKLRAVSWEGDYTSVHPFIQAGATNADYYLSLMFNECDQLASVSEIPPLPAGVTSAKYYLNSTFKDCAALTAQTPLVVPGLPGTVTLSNNYLSNTFDGCTGFTGTLDLGGGGQPNDTGGPFNATFGSTAAVNSITLYLRFGSIYTPSTILSAAKINKIYVPNGQVSVYESAWGASYAGKFFNLP
jgi:hypothetical protein